MLGLFIVYWFINEYPCVEWKLIINDKPLFRHKGDYYTQEDEGAYDAFDADTAVLQGRTGHQVQKKKEWFI